MSENTTGTEVVTQNQADATATLEHLDPTTLELETNVRDDAALDADFVASIAEHGVLNPIVAVRGADGVVRVRAGQRRTLAAREAGRKTVPVYVRPSSADQDEKAQTVERLSEQIVENDQRRALTDAQRARGIQQMLDAGVSVTKVAKKLGTARDTVKTAATAAGSAAAMNALDSGQLSLAEAAILSEFDDDPEAVERLIAVAGTNRFDHRVAEIRKEREAEQAYQQAAASYAEQGYTVLGDDEFPEYGDIGCIELRYLRTTEGEPATAEAITDPAHWAVYLTEEDRYLLTATGEEVDYHDIDWHTRYSGKDAAEGKHHPDAITETTVWEPDWLCTDYTAAGLVMADQLATRVAAIAAEADNLARQGDPAEGEGSDELDAAQREADAADAQRRERRKVIALNKLGEAAESVRRQFITDKILSRKTPPKGAAIFVATMLTRDLGLLNDYRASQTATELLGVTDLDAIRAQITALPATGDGRAQIITLALILGSLEARTAKDAWRGMNGYNRYVGPAELLAFLQKNGYTPADIERVILGEFSADELYDATLEQSSSSTDE